MNWELINSTAAVSTCTLWRGGSLFPTHLLRFRQEGWEVRTVVLCWRHILVCTGFFFFFLILFIFTESGREGEREREKHQCVVASHMAPTRDLACNPGMCPNWELNQWLVSSQASVQSTEPHQPGPFISFKKEAYTVVPQYHCFIQCHFTYTITLIP